MANVLHYCTSVTVVRPCTSTRPCRTVFRWENPPAGTRAPPEMALPRTDGAGHRSPTKSSHRLAERKEHSNEYSTSEAPFIRDTQEPWWLRESVDPWLRGSVDPWIIRGSVDHPWIIRGSVDHPWIRGSVAPWLRGSVRIRGSVNLSVCLSADLSVCLSADLSVCLSADLSVCLSVRRHS